MENESKLDFLTFLIVVLRMKRFLILLTTITFVLAYLLIYFLIHEQFQATTVIIPSDSRQFVNILSMSRALANLPLSMGVTSSKDPELLFYQTLIYSRTNLDSVIQKFDLIRKYNVKNIEEAEKAAKGNIKVEIGDDNTLQISAMSDSRAQAAEMANYIVSLLDIKMNELSVRKARDTREFLQSRFAEIKSNLQTSEDSMMHFQKKSGILQAENQVRATIETYSHLEAELATKKLELSITDNIYGENSPNAEVQKHAVEKFESIIKDLKTNKNPDNLTLPINELPENALNYYRIYRDITMYTHMLEVISPVFEQAKLEEQKNLPVMMIIDKAVPPYKRAYPQRVLFSAIIAISILLAAIGYQAAKFFFSNTTDTRFRLLREEAAIFRKRK